MANILAPTSLNRIPTVPFVDDLLECPPGTFNALSGDNRGVQRISSIAPPQAMTGKSVHGRWPPIDPILTQKNYSA